MADTRFILVGIILVFAGFIILGVLGGEYRSVVIESDEFDTCYEYGDSPDPVPVSCSEKTSEMIVFLGIVIAVTGAGAAALVRGARGDWDSKVKPEDMVGPGGSSGDMDEEKTVRRDNNGSGGSDSKAGDEYEDGDDDSTHDANR